MLPKFQAEREGSHGTDDVFWILREFIRPGEGDAAEIGGEVTERSDDGVFFLKVFEGLEGVAGILAALAGTAVEVGRNTGFEESPGARTLGERFVVGEGDESFLGFRKFLFGNESPGLLPGLTNAAAFALSFVGGTEGFFGLPGRHGRGDFDHGSGFLRPGFENGDRCGRGEKKCEDGEAGAGAVPAADTASAAIGLDFSGAGIAPGILEGGDHVGVALPAMLWLEGHHAVNRFAGGLTDPRGDFGEARDGLLGTPEDAVGRGSGFEGRSAGKGVVKGGAKGVDVAAEVLGAALEGFGGDVVGSGPDFLGLGTAVLGDESEAEVDELGIAIVVDEDVPRFDIAVDHAGFLGGLETEGDLEGDGENFVFREGPVFGHGPLEALAFEEFHDEVEPAVCAADGVNFDDVGMVDLGGEPGFVFEGEDAGFVVAVFLVEDLDGDFAAEKLIPAGENDAHASDGIATFQLVGSELAFDARFYGAVRADCGLERGEGGDVQKFSATFAGFVGRSGF